MTQFIDLDLLDEFTVSIIPSCSAGASTSSGGLREWKSLTLVECTQFEKSGIVLLTY